MVENANLTPVKLLMLNLYSGASFIIYNAICRNYPPNIVKLLDGEESSSHRNSMSTTIF